MEEKVFTCLPGLHKPSGEVPVLQYDLKGNFIEEYKSLSEAGRRTNTNINNMSENCNKRIPTAGGFIWKYKFPEKAYSNIPNREPKGNGLKRVVQMDVNTNKIIKVWTNVKEVEETLKITRKYLYSVCNGKTKSNTAHGFIWMYEDVK